MAAATLTSFSMSNLLQEKGVYLRVHGGVSSAAPEQRRQQARFFRMVDYSYKSSTRKMRKWLFCSHSFWHCEKLWKHHAKYNGWSSPETIFSRSSVGGIQQFPAIREGYIIYYIVLYSPRWHSALLVSFPSDLSTLVFLVSCIPMFIGLYRYIIYHYISICLVHVLIFLQFYNVLSSSRWSWSYLVDTGSPKNILSFNTWNDPKWLDSCYFWFDLMVYLPVWFNMIHIMWDEVTSNFCVHRCIQVLLISPRQFHPLMFFAFTTERDVTGLLGGLATKELPLAPSTQKRWGMVPSLPQSLAMNVNPNCLIPQFWDTYTFNKQSDSQTQKWVNQSFFCSFGMFTPLGTSHFLRWFTPRQIPHHQLVKWYHKFCWLNIYICCLKVESQGFWGWIQPSLLLLKPMFGRWVRPAHGSCSRRRPKPTPRMGIAGPVLKLPSVDINH